MATKEPIKEPEIRSQKLLYCWQIANQLAEALPLCAKYTIAADADAAAVNSPNIAYLCTTKTKFSINLYAIQTFIC